MTLRDATTLLAITLLLAACPAEGAAACDNDEQCKGERLCVDGQCEDPGGSAEAESGSATSTGTTTDDPTTTTTPATSTSTSTPTTSTSSPQTSTSTEESTGDPGQPYGICRFACETTADCCAELDCEGGTTWTCDDGLCRSDCNEAACAPIASVIFGCTTATVDIPGSSFCGATCENACSDVIDDPAYYCNMEAGYTPDLCSFDCGIDRTVCNGSNGTACLPNGTCGCYEPGDCAPGFDCFTHWE